jgi:hypothetical protein
LSDTPPAVLPYCTDADYRATIGRINAKLHPVLRWCNALSILSIVIWVPIMNALRPVLEIPGWNVIVVGALGALSMAFGMLVSCLVADFILVHVMRKRLLAALDAEDERYAAGEMRLRMTFTAVCKEGGAVNLYGYDAPFLYQLPAQP